MTVCVNMETVLKREIINEREKNPKPRGKKPVGIRTHEQDKTFNNQLPTATQRITSKFLTVHIP